MEAHPVDNSTCVELATGHEAIGNLRLWVPEAVLTNTGNSAVYPVGTWDATGGQLTQKVPSEHTIGPGNCPKVDEKTFVVSAKLAVEDLADELELPVGFPEDREYETVGGLVLDLAESVPEAGESFTYDGPHIDSESKEEAPFLRFKVIDSDGVKLGKIRLSIVPRETDDPE